MSKVHDEGVIVPYIVYEGVISSESKTIRGFYGKIAIKKWRG